MSERDPLIGIFAINLSHSLNFLMEVDLHTGPKLKQMRNSLVLSVTFVHVLLCLLQKIKMIPLIGA